VGIWQQTDVRYENCQLVVGQDSRGQLMGISFSTINRNKLIENDGPRYPKGTVDWSPSNSSKGFVARKLTIEQGPGGTYTWTSEISFKGNMWEAPTAKSGKIYLSTDQDGNPRISTKKLCMIERAAAGSGSFSKLALDEAIAMELPRIAQKDFPSPFATEGKQVASVPKAAASASAAPSTPTTTITTPVDPLVGVWKFAPADGVGWGYFIVGMDDQGGLAGFQWQNVHSETFGFRETTIKPLADESYSWHSDQSISLVNPSFAMGDAADGGKFWVSENENGLPTVTSSTGLFLQWRGLPPRQTLQKIALEQALALDIPAQLPKDFPSPLQNGTSNAVLFDKQENVLPASEEPIQIAKATSASTRGSENPALKSATSKPAKENLDPIVGIWVALDGVWGASDRCFAFIGRAADGTLIGKSWEEHDHAKPKGNEPYADLNIFSLRELEISPTEPGIFKWRADRSLAPQIDGIPSWLGAPQSGVFSLKQKGSDGYVLTSRDRLCRKSQHDLSATSFQKLSYDEVFALDLPQEILDGLPKPSGEEAQWNSSAVPVPKDSETSSATSAGKTERR
jgi:hypothetical protein